MPEDDLETRDDAEAVQDSESSEAAGTQRDAESGGEEDATRSRLRRRLRKAKGEIEAVTAERDDLRRRIEFLESQTRSQAGTDPDEQRLAEMERLAAEDPTQAAVAAVKELRAMRRQEALARGREQQANQLRGSQESSYTEATSTFPKLRETNSEIAQIFVTRWTAEREKGMRGEPSLAGLPDGPYTLAAQIAGELARERELAKGKVGRASGNKRAEVLERGELEVDSGAETSASFAELQRAALKTARTSKDPEEREAAIQELMTDLLPPELRRRK